LGLLGIGGLGFGRRVGGNVRGRFGLLGQGRGDGGALRRRHGCGNGFGQRSYRGFLGGLHVLLGRVVAAVAAAAAAATVAAPSGCVGGAGLGGQGACGTSRVALGAGRAFGAVFVAAAVAAGVARCAVGLRGVGAGFSAAMAVT